MNNNLSQQIVQMQNKQGNLEDDIKTLKKYKKLVNNSMAFQCKHCAQTLIKESYQDHLKNCVEETDRNRVSCLLPQGSTVLRATTSLTQIEIVVHQCLFQDDQVLYEFQIFKNNDKWVVMKSLQEIVQFSEGLK